MVDRAASKAEEALELDKVSYVLRLAEVQYLVKRLKCLLAFIACLGHIVTDNDLIGLHARDRCG